MLWREDSEQIREHSSLCFLRVVVLRASAYSSRPKFDNATSGSFGDIKKWFRGRRRSSQHRLQARRRPYDLLRIGDARVLYLAHTADMRHIRAATDADTCLDVTTLRICRCDRVLQICGLRASATQQLTGHRSFDVSLVWKALPNVE